MNRNATDGDERIVAMLVGGDELVDTSRPGGPSGPDWYCALRPRTRRAVVVALVLVVAAVVAAAITMIVQASERDRARYEAAVLASSPSQRWTSAGFPATSVGGGEVWTRCVGETRIWQTVGADGFPAGPPTLQGFGANGCPR